MRLERIVHVRLFKSACGCSLVGESPLAHFKAARGLESRRYQISFKIRSPNAMTSFAPKRANDTVASGPVSELKI